MKESKAKKTERIKAVLARLDEQYGTDVRCYLTHTDAWQLLVAVILSAQCTDARVNMVTPALFEAYPTPEAMGAADVKDVERLIHSVGFYHNKAKNIVDCSRVIAEEYGGVVPKDIDALTKLPGVGRKTANVIRGNVYDDPSIVVDTHVKRLAFRLGLTKNTDPVKIERDLTKIIPYEYWGWIAIALILHGRSICPARNPQCEKCSLRAFCSKSGVK